MKIARLAFYSFLYAALMAGTGLVVRSSVSMASSAPAASTPPIAPPCTAPATLTTTVTGTSSVTATTTLTTTVTGTSTATSTTTQTVTSGTRSVASHPTAVPQVATSPDGRSVTACFTVSFTSTQPGQGYIEFGTGPGCQGLVETATRDAGAGTTSHLVLVVGNDLPGSIGDNGILPGVTYYYRTLTQTSSGVELDDNGGACYSVTIPSAATLTTTTTGTQAATATTSTTSTSTGATASAQVDPAPAVYAVTRLKLSKVVVHRGRQAASTAKTVDYVFGRTPSRAHGSAPPSRPKFLVVSEAASQRPASPWRMAQKVGELPGGKARYELWHFSARHLDLFGNVTRAQLRRVGLKILSEARRR